MLLERKREYRRKYDLARYHKLRVELITLLGGKCVKCGTTEKLEIDHINRKSKSFALSSSWGRSKDKILSELEKCQLLCKSCHKVKSDSELRVGHGTWGMYRRKCRCVNCKAFVSAYFRNRKV